VLPFAPKDNIAGMQDYGLLHPARRSDVCLVVRGHSMDIYWSTAGGAEKPFAGQDETSRQLVEEAEQLALSDTSEPLHISALCVALAVSERTLRKAFHAIHGLPPCRHLRMLRLSRARRALLGANCELTTVTEIATNFGFVELGRFSVEYRKLFGESPSQTLSRASLPPTRAKSAHIIQDGLGF
jgi:transcriptional regulator GlxA family with amidase domain